MNVSDLGVVAAELMECLEDDFSARENVELGVVAVVAEVNWTDDEGEPITAIAFRCSDSRRWIQTGLFRAAESAVIHSSYAEDDEE